MESPRRRRRQWSGAVAVILPWWAVKEEGRDPRVTMPGPKAQVVVLAREEHLEGRYEIRLEMDESVWANRKERDETLAALEAWARGGEPVPEPGHPLRA